jgi:apolipoprotein N-acyltransferase
MSLTQRRKGAKTEKRNEIFAPLRLCVRYWLSLVVHFWFMAFLGVVLLWAALPPLDWWPLAWITPIPWVLLIRQDKLLGRRPYAVLTLAGFCFWMAVLHWLRLPHPATSIGWVALSLIFSIYLPLFVGLSRVAVHRLHVPVILAAPIVWTGLELARAHVLTGMTMASLGHTQYRWVELIQISDLAGVFGVSFVVMFVAASLARMISWDGRRWTLWPLAPAIVMLAATLLYGYVRLKDDAGETGPRIALIQGSIDVTMQYDPGLRDRVFQEYFDLSRKAVGQNQNLDLIVWPEAMFLYSLWTCEDNAPPPADYPGTDAEFRQDMLNAGQCWTILAQLAQSLGVPLLLGTDMHYVDQQGHRCYNSAAYVAPDGKLLGRYRKMHLVMFGEYVPFAQQFPWLQRLTPLPYSVMPGERPEAFGLTWGKSPNKKTCRIAPNICYETVLSHVIRGQINTLAAEGKEPDVLINLTNDGWYWGSSELDLHLACGVFRAVECRKPLLIAANTGFSAWIDADGRIQAQGPRRATDVLIAEPQLGQYHSWYLAHGDWFAGICLLACVLCGLCGFYRGKCDSGTTPPVGCAFENHS